MRTGDDVHESARHLAATLRTVADDIEAGLPRVAALLPIVHQVGQRQCAAVRQAVSARVDTIGFPEDGEDCVVWGTRLVEGLGPIRRPLPTEREGIVHKFAVGGHEGYIAVGLYADRRPAEMFITMSKAGSTVRGFADTIAKLTSLLLQFGVSIDVIADKFRYARFEPQGVSVGSEITSATSIIDYVFHWMVLRFGADAELRAWEPEVDLTRVGTDEVAPKPPGGSTT